MTAAVAVLATLAAAGLRVRAYADGRLMVGPAERLTPALRELIQTNKAAILAELLGPEPTRPTYAMPDLPTLRRLWRERARELLAELAAQPNLGPGDRSDAEYLGPIAGARLCWQGNESGEWRLTISDDTAGPAEHDPTNNN
jgi:hypothetical protein